MSEFEGQEQVKDPARAPKEIIFTPSVSASPIYRIHPSTGGQQRVQQHPNMATAPSHREPMHMLLGTLEESSSVSSSSDVSDTKRDDEKRAAKKEAEEVRQRLFQNDLEEGAPYRGMTANQKEIHKLKTLATQHASRGKEEDAIKVYHRALRIMKSDLGRIKKNLQKSQQKAPQARRGAEQLHEEWMQLATTLAEIRTIMAILYERMGEYEKAISSCEEAKDVYSSYARLIARNGIADSDIDEFANQMDVMLDRLNVARGSFDGRKELHEGILQCRVKIAKAKDPALKEQLYDKVFNLLNKVLDMERVSLGESHPQISDTLRIFATLYFEKGQFEHAVETTEDAIGILKLCLGSEHPRTALAMRSLAKIHEMRDRDPRDTELAIRYYNEAVVVLKQAYGPNHNMVGSTLNNVAVLHIKRGEYDEAVETLSDALISYESVADGGSSINPDAAQVWKNLGECYTRQREWENAHFAYTSALEVQREARRGLERLKVTGSPSSSSGVSLVKNAPKGSDDASMADTLLRLGRATKETGRHDDSYKIYKEGLRIFRKLYQASKTSHNPQVLAEAQDRLAHTMYCIAEVQEIRGHYNEAVQFYTESLNLRLNSDANRSENRLNMVHCAMALAGIGNVHMQKREGADACVSYNESLRFLKAHGVPDEHEIAQAIKGKLLAAESSLASSSFDSECSFDTPSGPNIDRTLEMDLDAEEQIENGEYDAAIKTLTAILSIRRQRLTRRQRKEKRTINLREKSEVARTLCSFAKVLRKKGEVKQSLMLFTEARRLFISNGVDDTDELIVSIGREIDQLSEGDLTDM